jgi:hypothetical protein
MGHGAGAGDLQFFWSFLDWTPKGLDSHAPLCMRLSIRGLDILDGCCFHGIELQKCVFYLLEQSTFSVALVAEEEAGGESAETCSCWRC